MAMDQAAPAPEMAPEEQGQSPGGAAQLVANIHTDMMKLNELVGAKFPDEAQALSQIISQYQQFVDGLGQSPGAQPAPAGPQTMPHGAPAGAKPVM